MRAKAVFGRFGVDVIVEEAANAFTRLHAHSSLLTFPSGAWLTAGTATELTVIGESIPMSPIGAHIPIISPFSSLNLAWQGL